MNIEDILTLCPENCQILSARCVEEVIFATIIAIKAFKQSRNIAKTIRGEILLRLAGEKQIKDAIKSVGAKPGNNYIVIFDELDPCKKLAEMLSKLNLKESKLFRCNPEEAKKSFEKAAITEIL
ncbi:putative KEOPS complex Cgi121-like subunit [Pyrococcus sp. ST04]|nr:putative KEOPS complex Cgi121-like subunit [Pyrococcus sp. ST04]